MAQLISQVKDSNKKVHTIFFHFHSNLGSHAPAWDEIPWVMEHLSREIVNNSLLVIGLGLGYPFGLNESKQVVFTIT